MTLLTLQDWLDGFAEAEERPDAATLYVFSDWCEEEGMLDWALAMRWMAEAGRWPWVSYGDTTRRFWKDSEFCVKTEDLLPDEFFTNEIDDWPAWRGGLRSCLQWLVHNYGRLSRESPEILSLTGQPS